ncbi:MAG TPA: glycosyltransferase family 87 protein [Anaerolineales bacterium]|nr:glycosyltransferase family 87 protein [Anaerolineales bacterium]
MSSTRNWLKATAIAALLAVVFALYAQQITTRQPIRDSNFAKFWIAGHMLTTGQSPYDPVQWRAAHLALGTTSIPDRIFLYPLPQVYFLTPLALLPIEQAFAVWIFASLVLVALCCYTLLRSISRDVAARLLLPLVLLLLLFGPLYLSMQIGSIGAIALGVLAAAILLLDRGYDLPAGLLLSFLILKPSQGLPIMGLAGLWLLFRQKYRAVYGLLGGSALLMLSGFLYDPQWVQKFAANSQLVSDKTLGAQSNVYSFAYRLCAQNTLCSNRVVGSLGAVILLALAAWYLWSRRERLSAWEAFDLIIPVGFVTTLYLWSYDQLLYVIPITWIAAVLYTRYRSYWPMIGFLAVLDIIAFVALGVQAYTKQDLLSLATTVIVLGSWFMVKWLMGKSETGNRRT